MRPDIDTYFSQMARLVATRGTCKRRQVGCILVNNHRHVIATGYSGVATGMPHCNRRVSSMAGSVAEYPDACQGADAASGTSLESCQAIHAEQNALLQCRDTRDIDTCYTTTCPCITCMKLLMNTSCKRIVYLDKYAHMDAVEEMAKIAKIELVWLNSNV